MNKYFSTIIKGTIAVSIANAGSQIINIILLPVYTRYLTPEDFGIFSLVNLIITFMALIYNPGIMTASIRMFHQTEKVKERQVLIGSLFVFFVVIPIIPILLSVVFGDFIFNIIFSEFSFYPFGLMALILAFFTQPNKTWITLKTLEHKLHKTAIYSIIAVVLSAITSVVLIVQYNMGAIGRVIGMFPSAIFLFIISFSSIKKFSENKWSSQSIKKQISFGAPLIIGLWSLQLLNFTGSYLLERLMGIDQVGLFGFATTVAGIPLFLVLGFKQMWGPILYENLNKKNYETISKLTSSFIMILSFFFIIFILFIKEVILIFIDAQYFNSISIIGIIAIAVFFNGMLTISNSYMTYANRFGKISIYAFISSIVCLLINLFFIPVYGITASAVALVFGYLFWFLLSVFDQKELIFKINSKVENIYPIFYLIFVSIITFVLNKYYYVNQINIFEIFFKISLVFFYVFLLFKLKIITKSSLAILFKNSNPFK